MREDEQVAEAMGVSTIRYKLLAFAMGGAIGCGRRRAVRREDRVAAHRELHDPRLDHALAIVILGGMGSIPGVVVGALVLIGLPGLLSEFEEYRLLIYGAVLDGDHDPAAAGPDPERPAHAGAPGRGARAGQVGRRTSRRTRASRPSAVADSGRAA